MKHQAIPCPPQPNTCPDEYMVLTLNKDITVLVQAAAQIRDTKPKRAAKEELSRRLSGVIGDLETIRMGLK